MELGLPGLHKYFFSWRKRKCRGSRWFQKILEWIHYTCRRWHHLASGSWHHLGENSDPVDQGKIVIKISKRRVKKLFWIFDHLMYFLDHFINRINPRPGPPENNIFGRGGTTSNRVSSYLAFRILLVDQGNGRDRVGVAKQSFKRSWRFPTP